MRPRGTEKILCTIQKFAGYLVAKYLKNLSNLSMKAILFFYKKTTVPNLLTSSMMTCGYRQYAI